MKGVTVKRQAQGCFLGVTELLYWWWSHNSIHKWMPKKKKPATLYENMKNKHFPISLWLWVSAADV